MALRTLDFHEWKKQEKKRIAQPLPTDRALTIREVSEKINASRSTIYRWMAEGNFPKGKRFGKCSVRWLESTIDAWMQSREG